MTSLREQLAKKRAHSTSLTFPLGEEGERAKAALEEAEQGLRLAQVVSKGRDDDGTVKRAEQRVKKARTAYEQVSVTISFRGLTDDERDALMSEHPATDEQVAKDKADDVPEQERSSVNRKTFTPAALAIAALDSDLTEEDWATELASDRWTAGERFSLYRAVVTATNAEPAPGIPKG